MNEELKFLGKIHTHKNSGVGRGGREGEEGVRWGSCWWGSGWM